MNGIWKYFVYFVLAWLVGTVYLLFKYFYPELFPVEGRMYGEIGVVGALVFFTLLLFLKSSLHLPQFRFLSKLLWGFDKTPAGFEDSSIRKHPVLVLFLAVVIFISAMYQFYIGFNFDRNGSLVSFGVGLFFLWAILFAIYRTNKSDKA